MQKKIWMYVIAALLVVNASASPVKSSKTDNPEVIMKIKNCGELTLELFPKDAPATVAHFLHLVNTKFYNGILFHRVVPHFVAQAGDPASRKVKGSAIAHIDPSQVAQLYGLGAGGSGTNVPFEQNSLKNEPGTIALALSSPASATGDSQFFINLVYNKFLDGQYCVFGKVVKGMNLITKIKQGDRIIFMKELKPKETVLKKAKKVK